METEEALQARHRLKQNPGVQAAIRGMTSLFPKSRLGMVQKQDFLRVHYILMRILNPKLSEEEVTLLGHQDWNEDRAKSCLHVRPSSQQGLSAEEEGEDPSTDTDTQEITVSDLESSLFELVDLWCQTLEASEYVALANTLRDLASLHLKSAETLGGPSANPSPMPLS